MRAMIRRRENESSWRNDLNLVAHTIPFPTPAALARNHAQAKHL